MQCHFTSLHHAHLLVDYFFPPSIMWCLLSLLGFTRAAQIGAMWLFRIGNSAGGGWALPPASVLSSPPRSFPRYFVLFFFPVLGFQRPVCWCEVTWSHVQCYKDVENCLGCAVAPVKCLSITELWFLLGVRCLKLYEINVYNQDTLNSLA